MLAHVVLFRPRRDLAPDARQALIAALETALSAIPSIQRWRIGPRVVFGHGYEARMRVDYPYIAILEFENAAALTAYLEHPAHAQLAARFYAVVEDLLVYDFEMLDERDGLRALGGAPPGASSQQ
jgi:hypothetical protein